MLKDKIIRFFLEYSRIDPDFVMTIFVLFIVVGVLGYAYGPW